MDAQAALRKVLLEEQRRKTESLRLFSPQPQQEPIWTSGGRFILARGGNRGGKTLSGGVFHADMATGYRRFGRLLHPDPTKLKLLFVSLDFSLLSENIYRKIFEPGSFKYCSRCFRVRHLCDSTVGGDGSCEQDGSTWKDRQKDAPPLIPPRLVKRTAWYDKSRGLPAKTWLNNGCIIDYRTTDQGRAKFQGVDWDWFWADEEATNDEEIMSEIYRGLIDRDGGGMLTATPLAASLTMVTWSEKAQDEAAEREKKRGQSIVVADPPTYTDVQLYTDENKALDKDAVERFFESMGEEEEGVRRRGEFLVHQGLVYGEFDTRIHVVDSFPVPEDWTIYELQDPGHANAWATLYWAVDPSGDNYLVDELYVRRGDVKDVVAAQKKILSGSASPSIVRHTFPQRSLIDPAAWQTGVGLKDQKVIDLIHAERRRQDHRSYEGMHKCYKANNEVRAGIYAVKALLKRRGRDEPPKLFVMRHLAHWLREQRRYRWPRPQPGKDLVEKQGPIKKDDHLMDTTRYGALARLEHVHPANRPHWHEAYNPKLKNTIMRFMRERKKKKRQDRMAGFSIS